MAPALLRSMVAREVMIQKKPLTIIRASFGTAPFRLAKKHQLTTLA